MGKEEIAIRKLGPDDWEFLRKIRIEMVSNNPEYFLESAEQAKSRSKEDWVNRLSGHPSQNFGFFLNGEIIGLIGVYQYDKLPANSMEVGALYISPKYRGLGLSKMGYLTCLDYAAGISGVTDILVSHREGNEPSKASILNAGFEFVGTSEKLYGDGAKAASWNYKKGNKQNE